MAASRRTAVAVAFAGALLAIASAAEAFGEIIPYFASGVGDRQRFEAIVSGAFEPAASKWSRDLYLDDCLDVPRSIFGLVQPSASRKRLLDNCRESAQTILRTTPNASNAWLVLATTSAALKDFATMQSALTMSKRTAPHLQWLADRRTRLVESHLAEFDPTSLADYESDLAVLAAGEQGIAVLAQRYARSPELRETYARIVDSSSPGRKRAFLAKVKIEMSK